MDRQVPFIALATVALSITLLTVGIVLDDESYIKIRPTIGSVAFATIVAIGFAFRPSILERSLGYKLTMTPTGWTLLHLGWIGLALSLAMLNELVRRNTSTDLWATYHAASGPVSFGLYWLVTWCVAWNYWIEDDQHRPPPLHPAPRCATGGPPRTNRGHRP